MFDFARPWWLVLVIVAAGAVWLWRRRRPGAISFSLAARLQTAGDARGYRGGGSLLRFLILLLLVCTIAGPRLADVGSRIPTQGIAIAVVLDVSGSMGETDFIWSSEPITRLEAAKRTLRLFVAGGEGPNGETFAGRPNDLVALVTFATWPESRCPLTLSHSVWLKMLEDEKPRSVPGESESNLSDALALALYRLEKAPVERKVILLISDGEHNVEKPQSGWTPRQAAQVAAALGVPIYAIDTGGDFQASDSPEEKPKNPELRAKIRENAKQTLKAISQRTSGRYFEGRNVSSLVGIYQQIDRLEKNQIESYHYLRYHEAYAWFGMAALGLLITLHVLEATYWRKLP
ncbi:MAG: aerotolerance regulator BatA [Gemmatales bacterium]|nr:MAG: aerotolerance regulator BatA [Gemmatales bacterium]